MTAEFAVAVPAVVLVLAACLGGLRIGVEQLRVVDAAAQAARLAAVGGSPTSGSAAIEITRADDSVCATATTDVPLLGLPVRVRARSCALAGFEP